MRGNPEERLKIEILEMLVRSPLGPSADELWTLIEALDGGADWNAMDRELVTP